MKTRRVGSLTCGIMLVLIGALCLLHIFLPALHYEYILRGWPIILILVGIEMLLANVNSSESLEIKYDFAAVVLVFLLVIFAACMGFMEFMVTYYGEYLYLL